MIQDSSSPLVARTLSDAPADTDAFGAHAKVANAIASLIKDESGGKSIALTGSWGSGKSTVVKHLAALLGNTAKEQSNIRVFVFDAWMHQSDPLRRAFLEQLIDFLARSDLGWVDPAPWRLKKEKLAKRFTITVTTDKPHLTKAGACIAVSAFFVPIGLALATNISDLSGLTGLSAGHLASLACFVATLPLWTLVVLLILRRVGFGVFERNKEEPQQPWYDLMSLLIAQTSSTTHHETTETQDPTSIEFQKDFRELVREALGSDRDRKLVLVIDNLDRVEADDARLIWSTMRTFLEVNNLLADSPLNRLWLVVPFDPSGIQRLWEKEASVEKRDRDPQQLSDSFISKAFQVTFKVPPPVLSDWTKFLQQQLHAAFPSHSISEDFAQTVQVYRLFARGITKPVTPREIKLFVNKLVALYRQWYDEIPFAVQATYALYQDRILVPEQDIAEKPVVDQAIAGVLDTPQLEEYLAALYFNVPVKKSLQVLLGRSIEEALESGSPENLSKYYEIDGFPMACENVVIDRYSSWIAERPYVVSRAALAISKFPSEVKTACTRAWRILTQSLRKVKDWKEIDGLWGRGVKAMLLDQGKTVSEETVATVLAAVDKTPTRTDYPSISAWVEGVLEIVAELDDTAASDALAKSLTTPRMDEFYLNAIVALAKNSASAQIARRVVSAANPLGLVEAFSKRCKEGVFSQDCAEGIALIVGVTRNWPWTTLASSADGRLRQAGPNHDEASALVAAIVVMYQNAIEDTDRILSRLAFGALFHYLAPAVQNNRWDAAAVYLLAILLTNPTGRYEEPIGLSSTGVNIFAQIRGSPKNYPQLITSVADYVVRFRALKLLIEKAESTSSIVALAGAIVVEIGQKENVGEYIETTLVLEKLQTCLRIVGAEELETILKKLALTTDLAIEVLNTKFDQNASRLYLAVFSSIDEGEKKAVGEFIVSGLRKLPLEQWRSELANDGDLLGLVALLSESGQEVSLGAEFHDALLEDAKKLVGESESTKKYHPYAQFLLKALRQEFRETFLCNLRDHLVDTAASDLTGVLRVYGNDLITSGVLSEEHKADEVVRTLFTEVIKRKRQSELSWAEKAMKECPSILKECRAASREALFAQIDLEKESDSQTHGALSRLAELLKRKK